MLKPTLKSSATPNHFFKMENPIQNYPWGSTTALFSLFEIPNTTQQPQAEMWMGTHPNGCSTVLYHGQLLTLSELINQERNAFLSQRIEQEFGDLPYLFKVLSAEKALSVQVHPSKAEAQSGFAREEALGIPLNAPHRNYKDANHKPELVYALTHYQAMNGFRSIEIILQHFERMAIPNLALWVTDLRQNPTSDTLKRFFLNLLALENENKHQAVDALLEYANHHRHDELYGLILTLSTQYPNDIGLFAPLMLNVITLAPGEAMFLDARTPHAYIHGTGLEIMANSDNVLRAGLTNKHIDLIELANCTAFEEKPMSTVRLMPIKQENALTYDLPVSEFQFTIYASQTPITITQNSADILLPLTHDLVVMHEEGETLTLKKGQSVFIPAYTGQYQIHSQGKVARVHS